MGEIGNGYGSECHLLRYLGRHRNILDEKIKKVVGCEEIHWLDFQFDKKKPTWSDAEIKGLDFLPINHLALKEWRHFWPQRGNSQNWDAVAKARIDGQWEWLLVEAKAHLDELESRCGAKEIGGRSTIRKAFQCTMNDLGVTPAEPKQWLQPYYQFCNRVTALNFLKNHHEPARLLFIYFLKDRMKGCACPRTIEEWDPALKAMQDHVGIPAHHEINKQIHKLFLDVKGT